MSAVTISQGFDSGNYANAYETARLDTALASPRLRKKSQEYREAFILGFFASYEIGEIPSDAIEEYQQAYFSDTGTKVLKAGYMDAQDWSEYNAQF